MGEHVRVREPDWYVSPITHEENLPSLSLSLGEWARESRCIFALHRAVVAVAVDGRHRSYRIYHNYGAHRANSLNATLRGRASGVYYHRRNRASAISVFVSSLSMQIFFGNSIFPRLVRASAPGTDAAICAQYGTLRCVKMRVNNPDNIAPYT